MQATQRQPGGGPATTSVRAVLPTWHAGTCQACGAPIYWFATGDAPGSLVALQPPLKAWLATEGEALVEAVPHWTVCPDRMGGR